MTTDTQTRGHASDILGLGILALVPGLLSLAFAVTYFYTVLRESSLVLLISCICAVPVTQAA